MLFESKNIQSLLRFSQTIFVFNIFPPNLHTIRQKADFFFNYLLLTIVKQLYCYIHNLRSPLLSSISTIMLDCPVSTSHGPAKEMKT